MPLVKVLALSTQADLGGNFSLCLDFLHAKGSFYPMFLLAIGRTGYKAFPSKPWFLRVCSTSLLKTLWEKEKLLVTRNFSFSHSVFHPFEQLSAIFISFEIVVVKLFQFRGVQYLLFGKG